MTEDEIVHVKAFFEEERSERFAEVGDKEKQRAKWTDKLNRHADEQKEFFDSVERG